MIELIEGGIYLLEPIIRNGNEDITHIKLTQRRKAVSQNETLWDAILLDKDSKPRISVSCWIFISNTGRILVTW